ncbi:MAG: hypothetical protein HW395_40 [candidate division NC10 bacterium]|nr:hypothetical protein [candidate division NC10 bacterium]
MSQPDYFHLACDITQSYKETLMSQPTAGQVASDCACSAHYFPESQKWAIYYCPLHAQAGAMRKALERFAIVGGPDVDPNTVYAMSGADILAVRAILAAIPKGA